MESSDLSTLMKRLSKEGYKVVYDPPGDGMCLYAAAAYQLCMDAAALKDMVFDYLQRNRFDEDNNDRLEFICSVDIGGVDVPDSWDEALQLLKKHYANSMIIRTIPEILHYSVTIVTVYGSERTNYIKTFAPKKNESIGTLYVGHSGNHYVALQPNRMGSSEAGTASMTRQGQGEVYQPGSCNNFEEKRLDSTLSSKNGGKEFAEKVVVDLTDDISSCGESNTPTKEEKSWRFTKGGKKRANVTNMEWWEKDEEYQPGISIFRGMRIDPPSPKKDFVDLTKDLSSSNESTPVKNEYKRHGFVKLEPAPAGKRRKNVADSLLKRGTNHQTFSKQSSSSDEELTHSIYSPAKRARKHGGRSNSSNDEKTADTDDERVSYHKIKKQRKFDPELWDNVVAENVSCLPTGIDGLCAYTIKCKATDKVKVIQTDGRKWKKSSATRWKNFGEMRYADCRGSYKCENIDCPYRVQYGVINRMQMKKREGVHVCGVCEDPAVFVECAARRYLQTGKKHIKVFHCGTHTCPVQEKPAKPAERVKEILQKNPDMKPAQVQSAFVLSALRSGEDWTTVVSEASQILDKKWIANQKQDLRKNTYPSGENFEALATFKEYCDKEDKLLVFKINDRRCNPDLPSYVFKTSKARMQIAENMNREGKHFMSNEYCFFDGKVKRCRNYVTLTASTYYPLLKRQIVLAVMEAERENSENIEQFWTLFNEALKHATQNKDVVFNPIGWCVDMAGSNMNGLKVFGEDALQRIKSCEFHFKQNRNKMAQKLSSDEDSQEFKTLCDGLLLANIRETYDAAKDAVYQFINAKPERAFLSTWVDWWDHRRAFIFRAFSPSTEAPNMNLAEVIHASWAHRDRANLSLLDVAQADTRDSVLLEAELKAFEKGNMKGGVGPSYVERRERTHKKEVLRAAQVGKEISKLRGNLVDPSSGHRPPLAKTGNKKKRNNTRSTTGSDLYSNPTVPSAPQSCRSYTNPTCNSVPQEPHSNPTCHSVPLPHSNQTGHSVPLQHNIPTGHSVPLPHSNPTCHSVLLPHSNPTGHPVPLPHGNPTGHPVPLPHGNPTGHSVPLPHSNPNPASQHPTMWHSGLSPFPYELVILPNNVRVCYGCYAAFTDQYRNSPYNVVIKHCDRRFIRRDQASGQPIYSIDFQNTYYHLDRMHVRRKNPLFNDTVQVSIELYQSLDSAQSDYVSASGLQINLV